jgi:hypothetical protein
MPMEQLQALADAVGVGYLGLDEEALRAKLVLEGEPVV